MNQLSKFMYGMGISMVLLLAGTDVSQAQAPGQAQGEGRQRQRPNRDNIDPQQFRERMMTQMRERLEVTNDDEWKLIQERIEKVNTARREVGFGGMGGFGGRMGMGGPPPGAGNQDNNQRRGPNMASNPEMEALQKAIESKASSEEIKSKLAKLRDARKTKEAALEKAQADLREVLSVRQEAIAVTMGLLR